MKTKPTTILLCLISYLTLTGFSFGKLIDDWKYKGTSIGVKKCIERSKQEGIDNFYIKEKCIDKHERDLSPNPPSKVVIRYSRYVQFIEIIYTNLSKDKIITYFELLVSHEDNKQKDGTQIVEKHKVKNLMISPNSQKWRTIYIVSSKQKYFIPKSDRLKNFNYSIESVKGIDFVVD
jgi:hypothetical protein